MSDVLDRLKAALVDRYAMERELGRGGMATVYLAEDLKHKRKVAVKVLHPELTAVVGPERFVGEIRILAKLSHPHILPLHDSGQADSFLYYVMPYVEGESLRGRLSRETHLPIHEAVSIARQMASALDYAHRHDVIHRDIKPENVMMQGGEAMVADFGIALAVEAAGGQRITETGLSLGTPEYMSPEQATGERNIDARSDLYSLGIVLYEMLGGSTPYSGPTVQAIIAKVLTDQLPNLRSIRDTVPEALEHAVRKSLAKLPADRFGSAAELNDALAAVGNVSAIRRVVQPVKVAKATGRIAWPKVVPWLVAGVSVLIAGWSLTRSAGPSEDLPVRMTAGLPTGLRLAGDPSPPMTVSPDNRSLVYVAHSGGQTQLYVRSLDSFGSRPLAGTQGATAPFFSPDGNWVGFFAEGQIKRTGLTGGAPLIVAEAPWSGSYGFAASWGTNDDIVFAVGLGEGLRRVAAQGGDVPDLITTPNSGQGEVGHAWPQVLDDGRILFTVIKNGSRDVALLSSDHTSSETVFRGSDRTAGAQYLPTGHLLYEQAGALFAVPLRLDGSGQTASSMSILDSVYSYGSGLAYFATSRGGTLAYAQGAAVAVDNALVWVDRDGNETPLESDPGQYLYPRISPDGQRVAVGIQTGGSRNIWVFDVITGSRSLITREGVNSDGIWTPDGRSITFASNRAGPWDLYIKASDGSGSARRILGRPLSQYPHSWSSDSRWLTFYELSPTAARDVWVLSVEGDSAVTSLLTTTANERAPLISPDGQYMAYVSDESGRNEVYVQPFPDLGSKWTISVEGGTEPIWSSDGTELFYRRGDQLMVVDIQTTPTFTPGQRRVLFEGRYDVASVSSGSLTYDVSPDGQRFVMVRRNEESVPRQLHVVLNWFSELERQLSGESP